MKKNVNIAIIKVDSDLQSRAALSQEVVESYADALKEGATFPPVTLFFDGADHWLADGFHRYHACQLAGLNAAPAAVLNGTRRDALRWSLSANQDHGLRRSNADIRKIVLRALADEEWGQWSDREIAGLCGVSHTTVANHRRSLAKFASEAPPEPREVKYTTKHGTEAVMQTENIGKAPSAPPATTTAPSPDAPMSDDDLDDAMAELDQDIGEELGKAMLRVEELNKEVADLKAIVEADDQKAKTQYWRALAQQADIRKRQVEEEIAGKERRIKFLSAELQKCGKAVGENNPDKIAQAVTKAVRAAKEAA